jgi:hypothetical protein
LADIGHCARFAAAGMDSDTRLVGGVEKIAGAVVGEGSSGVARIGFVEIDPRAAIAVASIASAMVRAADGVTGLVEESFRGKEKE